MTKPAQLTETWFSADKPISDKMARAFMTIQASHKDQPLVLFDSNPDNPNEGWVALHVPAVYGRSYDDPKSVSIEETGLHGLPERTGAVNG